MKNEALNENIVENLKSQANQIRCSILDIITDAQVGHIGGSFSIADVLAALYFHILNIDPKNPGWPDRDRLILSKGHGAAALYSTLALRGYFPHADLKTFGFINSNFQVHPDKNKVPGVEASTGALGQGLSIGAGVAFAAKLDNKAYRTYVVLGDGEIQEGQVWEAAMFCAHYKLDNITAILDYNNVQLMGNVPDIMGIAPVKDKWDAFGWKTVELDGHDIEQIISACSYAKTIKDAPTIIIAKTIKGKGVSFMQGTSDWHGKVPCKEEHDNAVCELVEPIQKK